VNYNSCGAETTYPSGAPEVTSLSLVGFALFFEILLKVALSTINQIKSFNLLALFSIFFLCHCGPWVHHIVIYYLKKNVIKDPAKAKINTSLLMHNFPPRGIEGIQHSKYTS
jgi:hypothetical protein